MLNDKSPSTEQSIKALSEYDHTDGRDGLSHPKNLASTLAMVLLCT
ncbi:hypothetical protein [Psychrobacter sp. JCM 18901]|nr:hypothetical protein [Psychrobacter sp. JCM 18901]